MSFARWVVATACLAAACSAPPPAPTAPQAPPPSPLHGGPLSDYVPAPGLRWLVLVSPSAIAREPRLMDALTPLVPEAGFQGLSERNGFDVRKTSSALVAGFDLGTLYLVSADGQDARMADTFQSRLLTSPRIAHPHPRLTRVTGVAGTTPESLLRADSQLVAVAVDDPALVRVVEGYLLGRFRKTPPARRGAALTTFATFAEDAPLRVFFPGPFDEQDVPGPLRSTLLAGATAAALAVSFRDVAAVGASASNEALVLHAQLVLAGDWSTDEDAPARLRAAWDALSSTAPGRWFGLDRPVSSPEVRKSSTFLELQVDLDGHLLFRALKDAANAELRELFADTPVPATENRSDAKHEAQPVDP